MDLPICKEVKKQRSKGAKKQDRTLRKCLVDLFSEEASRRVGRRERSKEAKEQRSKGAKKQRS